MTKSASIQTRIDPALKEQVERVFDELGLTASQAITLFYQQVRLTQGLPFEVRLPNEVTRRTFADTDAGRDVVRAEDASDLFRRLGC
jgi:DNA-damage-inducible protein J